MSSDSLASPPLHEDFVEPQAAVTNLCSGSTVFSSIVEIPKDLCLKASSEKLNSLASEQRRIAQSLRQDRDLVWVAVKKLNLSCHNGYK